MPVGATLGLGQRAQDTQSEAGVDGIVRGQEFPESLLALDSGQI